ncbi:MAG: DUF1501 domain-containing protein [Deltaproteobacteria bacterium]|nr:MAG: DUF1501 domain-containing protein [Deltaproteobacteria bacterium]
MIDRRQLLKAGAATLVAPSLVRPARAASAADRRFLFVFAQGGWDPTYAFAPVFGSDRVDMPEDAGPAEIGGISFVEHADIPSVRTWLEQNADRTCIVNGIEVRAVAHDACRRIAMTNSLVPGNDDWSAILAGEARSDPLIPLIHISGPSYTHRFPQAVVRVGTTGQLGKLVDGTALTESDMAVDLPGADAQELEDALVRDRAHAFLDRGLGGRAAAIAAAAARSEDRLPEILGLGAELSPGEGDALVDRLGLCLGFLSTGVSRCAMVAYESWQGVFNGWDTHQDNSLQANHFEELFAALTTAWNQARTLPGSSGGSLADELVIVVLSEMGRMPLLNGARGKDHWTWTSAMVVGAGVAGGQVIGGFDEGLFGRGVDLESGAVVDGNPTLLPGHLGATLLALGDVDPGAYVEGAEVIGAMLA